MSKSKEIQYGSEARDRIIRGVDKLANAVKVTLGPMGRNVIIGKDRRNPHITKDGVSVAREVVLSDPFENMGAQMVKEAASKAAEVAGDGTTTATVLTEAIVHEGAACIDVGISPIQMSRGITAAAKYVIEVVNDISIPCDDDVTAHMVATISANGDKAVATTITDAFGKVGADGIIMVEDGVGFEDSLEFVTGIGFNQGYVSPYFINNVEKAAVVLSDPLLMLVEDKIDVIEHDLVDIIKQCIADKQPLVIIAEDFSEEFIRTTVMLTTRSGFRGALVKAPGFGERRVEELLDIATVCGGDVISHKSGISYADAKLGSVVEITIHKDSTTILFAPGEHKPNIEARKKMIKQQISDTVNEFYVRKLEERYAKLSGGVCIIKVGATTELELKERKDRYDDAIRATRAAIQDGIVAGGGLTLYNLSLKVDRFMDLHPELTSNESFVKGVEVFFKALSAPIRTILINAGITDFKSIESQLTETIGYDAFNFKHVNMIDSGIIDPAKVTKSAIKAAASIAGLILTTECAMVDINERSSMGDPILGNV